MSVLYDIICNVPAVLWIVVIFTLGLISLPFWKWLEYRLDVKEYGKEVADELRSIYE